MGKTAWLFPGQGSQKVGMGADLLEAQPDVFDRYLGMADEASGLQIRQLCLEGPIEELTATEVAQPALFATSLAVVDLARTRGSSPDYVAGHSLGEYTAAVVSGALVAEDGMRLVSRRGQLMAGIQSERPGAMARDHRPPSERVRSCARRPPTRARSHPANLNTPAQIVCSGEDAAVGQAARAGRAGGRGQGGPAEGGRRLPQRADGAGPGADGAGDGRRRVERPRRRPWSATPPVS